MTKTSSKHGRITEWLWGQMRGRKVGEVLPTTREIGNEFGGVSVGTAEQAYGALIDAGWVKVEYVDGARRRVVAREVTLEQAAQADLAREVKAVLEDVEAVRARLLRIQQMCAELAG